MVAFREFNHGLPAGDAARYLCSVLRSLTITAALLLAASPALADDPFERLSGTEDWRVAGPEDPDKEWRDWYRLRVESRRSLADLRLQAARSHRLAVMLRKSAGDRPDMGRVRKVMRARLVDRPKEKPAPRRNAAGRVEAGAFLLPGETAAQVAELEEDRPRRHRGRGRGRRGKRTPEPPTWVKVPVERLDDSGQAIDDEGDAVLKKSVNKDGSK